MLSGCACFCSGRIPPWGGTGSAPGFRSAGLPPFSLRTPAAPPRPLRNVQRQFFLLPPAVGKAVSFHRGVNRLFCSVPDKPGLLCLPDAASVPSRPVRHSAALTGQQYGSGFILPAFRYRCQPRQRLSAESFCEFVAQLHFLCILQCILQIITVIIYFIKKDYNVMERKDFSLSSPADGLELRVIVMTPDNAARGIVQISHGMAEHKERYFEYMEFLTAAGFICVIHDHRGHGESVVEQSDLGYFYDTDGIAVVDDVHAVTLRVKELYPNLPLILFGHSMGSLIVRSYIKKYDRDIDMLIVCGSPSRNPMVPVALLLVNVLSGLKGDRYRSGLVNDLAFGSFDGQTETPGQANRWLSTDEETVKAYNNDLYCGFTFTLNGFHNLFSLLKTVYHKKGWNVQNPGLPVLFIAGEKDPVIGSEKAWLDAQQFLRDRGYTDVSGILYDGMRHEILNEQKKELVYHDVCDWIQEHLK